MAERIIHAAMELFAKKGYSATSVREIVQAADVTNPMLYYYFDSKEGLFHKLINLLFEHMDVQIANVIDTHASLGFQAQLREIIRTHVEVAQESPVALQFIYAVLFGPRDSYPDFDPIAKRAPSVMKVYAIFDQAVREGVFTPHPGFSLEFLTMQFFGVLNQHLLLILVESSHECDESVLPYEHPRLGEETLDHLMTFFLRGAGSLKDVSATS